MGIASRGIVRRLGCFSSRAATGVSLSAVWCLSGAIPRGQLWTSAVTLPQGRNGLSAWRMAVLSTFRAPSLCRQVHRELMRSALLDLTPIVPINSYHKENYIETYLGFHLPLPAAARRRCGRP